MRKAVRPIRQLLVGALATIADECDAIAEPLLDDPVGQFDRGVEIFGVLKLRPIETQFPAIAARRQISPRKIVNMTRWAKLKNSTDISIVLVFGMKPTANIQGYPAALYLPNILYLKQFGAIAQTRAIQHFFEN